MHVAQRCPKTGAVVSKVTLMAGATIDSRESWLVRRVPRWLREVLLVGVLYGLYELCRGLQGGSAAAAARNGWAFLHWERAVGLSPEHLLTVGLLKVTPLCVAAAYFYSTMHYVTTPLVLVWMYRWHGRHYRTARTALAVSTMLSLIVFDTLPTAPPRLLSGSGVPDALFVVRRWGWWSGDGSVPRGLGGLTNQFAAMPSLHVGWALWCGVLLWRYNSHRTLRVLGVVYPFVTASVVLATGNHYLLDVLAGVLVMALGLGGALVARSVTRRVHDARVTRAAVAPTERPTDELVGAGTVGRLVLCGARGGDDGPPVDAPHEHAAASPAESRLRA